MVETLKEAIEKEEDLDPNELELSFSKRLFDRFIEGRELSLSLAEIEESCDEATIHTVYNSLIEKGIMQWA